MSSEAWWSSAVVYQIYPRSFLDTDGDGIGDLRGVIERVDHLAELGVDVVWLSPINRSPQADNGYDISDYQDIDPLFGDLATFDELLDALHRRGMKLMMDLVVNHTSDEHPWFVESRASRTSPRRDWYVWRDRREGDEGPEPNNWGAFFGGSAWEWDDATGQYYLHLFHRKQPDLNWENPEVRAAVHQMMRWWLDRGVDGFRMDVINFISKVPGLPDVPPVPGRRYLNGFRNFVDGPRIHEYLAEMTREVFHGRDGQFITVGEMPGTTVEEAALYTDRDRAEVDMVFQFEHVTVDSAPYDKYDVRPLDLVALKRSLHRWQTGLADRGWNSLYWCNHDQPRVVSRFGDDHPDWWQRSATALATVLHGMRGTPYVYQGEEIGMTNFPFTSADQLRDTEAIGYLADARAVGRSDADALAALAARVRDNARTPMQWDASAHGGFTTGTPWLAVNPNHTWLNVEAQRGVPGSVLEHHRHLVRLRHEEPILASGRFEPLLEQDPDVWAYERVDGSDRLLVVANMGRVARPVELGSHWAGAAVVLGNVVGSRTARDGVGGDGTVHLEGWEAVMLRQAGAPLG